MTLYILDTDHISLQQRAHPVIMQRLQAIGNDDSVAVTIITVESRFVVVWKLFADTADHHSRLLHTKHFSRQCAISQSGMCSVSHKKPLSSSWHCGINTYGSVRRICVLLRSL
jgi:hypothetical protein